MVAKKRKEIVDKIKSEFLVLTPEGKEIELDLKTVEKNKNLDKYPALKKFIIHEEVKGQPHEEPPSIKAMQKLQLVGYCPESDPGNFRFYPAGAFVLEMLKSWSEEIMVGRLDGLKIETPLFYDWSHPAIKAQGESFHEKHYTIHVPDKKKELVLRFAGDFGLFAMMKNVSVSHKQLPLRIYEISPSFRYETRSELSGLRRLRAFTMPDIHCFCKDVSQGWEEYQILYKNYADLLNGLEIEYAIAFRIVREFYEKYKDKLIELLKYSKKPALIEILSGMKHYWAVKHEFQGIDSVGGNCQLSTVQLDIEDAERYGIMYADKDNKKKGCIICHSTVGSLERLFYCLLEEALKSKNPLLPLWLSPTQVRLCPVNDSFIGLCEKIANKMDLRVDIDDRTEGIGKKIRDAEVEWTPIIVVIGEKEEKSGKLAVRFRETGEIKDMEASELEKYVKDACRNYPYRELPLPKMLSKRPVFFG